MPILAQDFGDIFFFLLGPGVPACAMPWSSGSRRPRTPSRSPPRKPRANDGKRHHRGRRGYQWGAVRDPPPAVEPRFSAELMDLIVDKSVTFHGFLHQVGIETSADLCSVWPSGQAMVTEYEKEAGQLAAEEAFALVVVHTKAAKLAKTAMEETVSAVVDERSSSARQMPARQVEDEASTSIPPKLRMVIAAGGPAVSAAPILEEMATLDPHVREEAMRNTKLDALFQFVLENLLDLKELGMDWNMLRDPARLQHLKESLMAGPSRLSVQRISALTSSMRRWKRFAVEQGYHVRLPTPLQVAEFLQMVGRGGPTAASSMFQVMKWFEVSMGNNFHTDHFLVKPHRLHAATHAGKQAVELAPWEFFNLLLAATKAKGTHLIILCFMLLSAVSCIRFEHVQRSRLIKVHHKYLEFWCTRGKSRKKGARPPFSWTCPDVQWHGWSLQACLRDFFQNECLSDRNFLWPALKLSPEDLWELCDSTPFVVTRPMSRSRFLELLRGGLLQVGVPREEANCAGYNRLRRFLPTLGNCLQVDRDSMQSLGNWVEIPSGGGPQPTVKERGRLDMSMHYSGQKTHRSAQVKLAMLDHLMMLFRRKQVDFAFNVDGLLCRDAWSWEELCTMQQYALAGNFKLPVEEVDPPGGERVGPEVRDTPEDPPPLPTAGQAEEIPDSPEEELSGSETTSSSASDVSAEAEDLVGILPMESIGTELPWFQQCLKVHLIKNEEEGRLVPWCRDRAFRQDPCRRGEGFMNVDQSRVCQRCLARVPRAVYTALADHCQWLH